MLKALWATALGTGLVLAYSAPGFAQMRTSQPQRPSGAVTAYSTPKPSGALGLFGWYPFLSSPATSASALAPGLAANLWFTPNLSFGIWGFTAAFPGYGNVTSADLEGKVKFFQSGTGVFGWALTGTGGAKYLSYTPGTGVGVALGLILDVNLPQRFVLQGRVGYTPWLSIAGTNRMVLDGKLGIGYSLTNILGVDAGLRTQTLLSGPETYNLVGPYLGLGFVF
jgi:hypothetical protein